MATQHPDHAGRPYWQDSEFISTAQEAKEAYLCFSHLGISEYKWDWEGKLVDESVLERLLTEHWEYFQQNPLGREKYLTFRLPNPKVETEFRMGRALMGILSAAGLARQVKLHSPPLFEVILPMTESAEEMIEIQEAFAEIANLKHRLYNLESNGLKHIKIIPLFEQVGTIINSDHILRKYVQMHKKSFGKVPEYIRPYVARSDPALNSGLVPTVTAIKIALSHYKDFEKETGIPLYPVVGVGTLPFRGGINPLRPDEFVNEYKGIRTAIIQSAFRYDFPVEQVVKAIRFLEQQLPKGKAKTVTPAEEKTLKELIKPFESAYQKTIEEVAYTINHVAAAIPRRRERVQHVGLFGYSRGVGTVKLPRAISFTAAMYSLGVPPELIGTGRGLAEAKSRGQLRLLEKFYVNLKKDLLYAGRYLYKPGLIKMAKHDKAWQNVLLDIKAIEEYLGQELKPKSFEELEHYRIVGKIHRQIHDKEALSRLIEKAALMRKSMG